jgi:hypothetical protein
VCNRQARDESTRHAGALRLRDVGPGQAAHHVSTLNTSNQEPTTIPDPQPGDGADSGQRDDNRGDAGKHEADTDGDNSDNDRDEGGQSALFAARSPFPSAVEPLHENRIVHVKLGLDCR